MVRVGTGERLLQEAAAELKLSKSTVNRLCDSGELKARKEKDQGRTYWVIDARSLRYAKRRAEVRAEGYPVCEAAALMGYSTSRLGHFIREGRVKAVKTGPKGSYRVLSLKIAPPRAPRRGPTGRLRPRGSTVLHHLIPFATTDEERAALEIAMRVEARALVATRRAIPRASDLVMSIARAVYPGTFITTHVNRPPGMRPHAITNAVSRLTKDGLLERVGTAEYRLAEKGS